MKQQAAGRLATGGGFVFPVDVAASRRRLSLVGDARPASPDPQALATGTRVAAL